MGSIVDLFNLMPTKEYDIHSGYYIVMFIGFAKLVDMATSINSQIINYSLTLYNIIKLAFIYVKFKIQPFSKSTLSVLGIGILSFGVAYFVPDIGHSIVNLIIKSILIAVIYISLTLKLKVSEDISDLWRQTLQKIGYG